MPLKYITVNKVSSYYILTSILTIGIISMTGNVQYPFVHFKEICVLEPQIVSNIQNLYQMQGK